MPRVTVLMPTYNAEKYLREAIESILQQTFTDFEFLIIDDGSTDNSIDIIRSYKDTRIRLVKNGQNIGISRTLNRGIELAASDIIARMDADDISLPDRLKKQYKYLQKHPKCSLVSSNVELISETGESLDRFQPEHDLFYYNLTFLCWIYHPTVMYKRPAIKDLGFYPLTPSEDYRLWSKLIRKYLFYNIQDICLKYRISNQSVSNFLFVEKHRAAAKIQIKENLRYFVGEDYTIPDDWLEAYRNNFEPIIQKANIREMSACIRELDFITPHILAKENINHDPVAIKKAARQKKAHILKSFLKDLPTVYKIQLLYRTGEYIRLVKFTTSWCFKKTMNLIPLKL